MKNLIKNQIKTLKESFNLLVKNPVYLFVPVLIDILFLFVFGFFWGYLANKNLPEIGNYADVSMGATMSSDASSYLLQNAESMTNLIRIAAKMFFQLIILFVVLWIIFQSINWFLASRAVSGKTSFGKFFMNFFVITLLFVFLGIVISIIFSFIAVAILAKLVGVVSPTTVIAILLISIVLIPLAVVLYFLGIGYSISNKNRLGELVKKTFVFGIKNFKNMIMAYITLIVLFFLAAFIMKIIAVNYFVSFVYGIVIILPLINLGRVYLININKK